MKTTKLFMFFLSAFILLNFSCDSVNDEVKVEVLDTVKDSNKINEILNSSTMGIPFPNGAKVFKVSDDNFRIQLPTDVFFLIKNLTPEFSSREDAYLEAPDAGVTCSCSSGSGCSPVKVKGAYYCVMNTGCKTCSMSTSRVGTNMQIDILGIIDYNVGVSFVSDIKTPLTSPSSDLSAYSTTEDFFRKKEVKKALIEFYDVIYNGNVPKFIIENKPAPSGYSYAVVNLFGNKIMVPVMPETISRETGIFAADDAAFSCSCSSGSGCTKNSFMGAKYCDAGSCKKCTLND